MRKSELYLRIVSSQGQKTTFFTGGERLRISHKISHGHRRFRSFDNRRSSTDPSHDFLRPKTPEALR